MTFLDLFKALSESSHALLCAARMEPQGNTVGFRRFWSNKNIEVGWSLRRFGGSDWIFWGDLWPTIEESIGSREDCPKHVQVDMAFYFSGNYRVNKKKIKIPFLRYFFLYFFVSIKSLGVFGFKDLNWNVRLDKLGEKMMQIDSVLTGFTNRYAKPPPNFHVLEIRKGFVDVAQGSIDRTYLGRIKLDAEMYGNFQGFLPVTQGQ